jgi:hypothetical protein
MDLLIITIQAGGASESKKHDARQTEQLAVMLRGPLELSWKGRSATSSASTGEDFCRYAAQLAEQEQAIGSAPHRHSPRGAID